jgi:hypothetical protein
MMLFRGVRNTLSTLNTTALLSNVDPDAPNLDLSPGKIGMTLGGVFKEQFERVIVCSGTCFAVVATAIVYGWILKHRTARRGVVSRT